MSAKFIAEGNYLYEICPVTKRKVTIASAQDDAIAAIICAALNEKYNEEKKNKVASLIQRPGSSKK